jgi:hypothetical protein
MRIDPDCRDPDLLAAEVRRLRAVIAAGDCPDQDNAAKPDRLTDAEREAVEVLIDIGEQHDDVDKEYSASVTVRGLLERLK